MEIIERFPGLQCGLSRILVWNNVHLAATLHTDDLRQGALLREYCGGIHLLLYSGYYRSPLRPGGGVGTDLC